MAGAPESALDKGRSLLQAMSDANKLYLVPGGIGAGSNMKMVHQVLAGIHILGASEAMGFAATLGLGAVDTAEAIKGSGAWTWMHENRLQRMLGEDWNPGASALTIILKDVVSCPGPGSFLLEMKSEITCGAFRVQECNSSLIEFIGDYHDICAPKSVPDSTVFDC
jgi:hypothetical protein